MVKMMNKFKNEKPKIAINKSGNSSMKLQLKLMALEGKKALAIIDELNKEGGSYGEFSSESKNSIRNTFGEIKGIVQDLDRLRVSNEKYIEGRKEFDKKMELLKN